MYKIGSMPHSIPIGYTGETNFRSIEIDMTAWMDKMPDGVPSIVHIRPGEEKEDAYVAVTEFDRETGILSWTITAADIGTLEGEGEMQVWLEETENDTVNKRGKSVIVKTKVIEAANDPDENVPTSQEAFIEQVTSLKTQTVTAKEAAEDAQAAAEDAQEAAEQAAEDAENVNLHPAYIDETTKHWMVYDADNHQYVDTQIKAQGEDGQDGQDATPTLVCPAYADLTFPVSKDTLCYKDGTLYKAKQDISTSEAWTAAHWDATNLATEQRLLKTAIQGMNTATASDVGKALSPKTVNNGKVKEWQFVPGGGGSDIDDTAGAGDTDKAWSADKLTEELGEKAPVIVAESDSGYYHALDKKIKDVTFDTSEFTEDIPVRYAFSKNLFEGKMSASSGGGLTKSYVGKRFLKIKGTSSNHGLFLIEETSDADFLNTLKGKTVKICLYISMQNTWSASYTHLDLLANGSFLIKNWSKSYGWRTFDVTFPDNLTSLLFKFDDVINTVFAEGDFIWIGCYETAITDTETPITEPYTIVMQNGEQVIDTVMHPSIATYNEDTKKYVDEHTPDIIGYWNNHIYALPEDFGAVGNGVADDATAIAACLAYAATSGKAVRGYGKYKTSSPVVIGERYMDVYFREIYYTGNDAAVKLMNGDIRFEFHRITSTGIGVFFTKNNDASPKYASRCRMIGNEISSSGNCIQVNASTYYNTCEVRYLSSQNDNCIEFLSPDTGEYVAQEYVFRSSTCHCPNGCVAKKAAGKMYDFTIEGDCKYGLYNSRCDCFGFRHREQVDGMKYNIVDEDPNYNNGALITFTNRVTEDGIYAFKYISKDSIPWFSIDVSAMDNYDSIPSGQGSVGVWQRLAFNGNELGTPIRGIDQNGHAVLGEKLFFIGNHKVFVPAGRKEITIINSEYDYRLYEKQTKAAIVAANNIEFATDFIIGVSHTDIYFNASFGAIGYNDLTVTQENGNTCTIYDKLGNVLFDGTNEGDGKWSLKCVIDRGSFGRLSQTTNWWLYDGTNEKWEVTKLS